ncbi:MAG: helix-turn-helix domain-containing protein [Pseudanabaena sp. RU_4_16]|nr:helix-turn-helix domain-containing protein [Pseudanabaena sp. SU_2_4]NJM27033.1 helix-turn-helix domain-containing protein [Pseudanabaena sp. RU_4_16]NKB18128.1 helix-turn-helix domain-containing protein [Pseudanabaena sp. CRU_2_10]
MSKGLSVHCSTAPQIPVKADKLEPKVLQMVRDGYSYCKIAKNLNLSKTTVNNIVKRHRQSVKNSELEK